jgi:hypothetical protein
MSLPEPLRLVAQNIATVVREIAAQARMTTAGGLVAEDSSSPVRAAV